MGCLFVWGFLFQHLVEMICLLSAVDLLLSSSAAHYCSHKAARSGERQGGGQATERLYPARTHDTLTPCESGRK